jgi:hypothetical protein
MKADEGESFNILLRISLNECTDYSCRRMNKLLVTLTNSIGASEVAQLAYTPSVIRGTSRGR